MKKIFLGCLTMCAVFAFTAQETQAQDLIDFRVNKIQKVQTNGVNPVVIAKNQANQDRVNGQTTLLKRALVIPTSSGKATVNDKKLRYRSQENQK